MISPVKLLVHLIDCEQDKDAKCYGGFWRGRR
uniref:Uncharacterized protein n=1 Tax=Anguilla anguilla TaxID=7936 RepID=A0A0E9TL06_ANGAN